MGQPPYPSNSGQGPYGQGPYGQGPSQPYGSQPGPYAQPSANAPYGSEPSGTFGTPPTAPYGAAPAGQLGGYGQPSGYGPQGPTGYGASPQGPAPKRTGMWIAIGAAALVLVLALGGLIFALTKGGEKAGPSSPAQTTDAPTTTAPPTTDRPTTTAPTTSAPTTNKPTTTAPTTSSTGPTSTKTGAAHTVEYRVKVTGGQADIDFQDPADISSKMEKAQTATDWSKTYNVTGTVYAMLMVAPTDYSNKLTMTCEIVVDGAVVESNSGTSMAICSKFVY